MLSADATDVTAIVAFNDPMAMGIYQGAVLAGISIPDQLSVVGVDDFQPVAAALLPGLTTVSLPHYEMGRWGVVTALTLLESEPRETLALETRMPGTLVTRDSVSVPRRS